MFRIRCLFPFGLFMLLGILFFREAVFEGKIPWGYDTPKIMYPLTFLLDESFKNRKLPLWTPDIFFGFPIGAEGQIGLFYPPNLLHSILSLETTVILLFFIHFSLAGIFTYLFCRALTLGRLASFTAGLIFMTNGFILAHFQYPSHIYAYPYLPLALLIVERALQKKKIIFFSLAGILVSLQFFTGHPNIPVMTLIALILYSLVRLWNKKWDFIKGMIILAITLVSTTLPYSLQLATLLPLSTRASGVDFTDAANSSFSLFDFITFIFPNFFFGDLKTTWVFANNWHFWSYWGQIETTGYVGITALFLAGFAFLKKPSKTTVALITLLVVSLILALGKHTPLYGALFQLPFFSGLRAPGRFLYLVDFSLAILAGVGMHQLIGYKTKGKKLAFVIGSVPLVIITLAAAGYYLTTTYTQIVYVFMKTHYGNLGFVANLDNQKVFIPMVAESFSKQTLLAMFLIFLTASLTVLYFLTKKLLLIAAMTGIIAFDLFTFASKVNLWVQPKNTINKTNPTINKLKDELTYDSGRVYTFSNPWSDLMPNQLLPLHIPEANGFVSLPLKRFTEWQKNAEGQWSNNQEDLFRIGSIKYVYYQQGETPKLTPIKNPLPRAYLANSWIIAKGASNALDLLISSSFDIETTVVIEPGNDSLENRHSSTPTTPAIITNYEPDRVKIQTDSPQNSLLVLTDTYYPNWEASIDGKKTKIYQTNYLFRGVFVPAGQHQVEFKYYPFRLGRN